jgi:hypothetical protein
VNVVVAIVRNAMSKATDAKKRLKPNKPSRSYKKDKKFMVLAKDGAKTKLIHFGAKGYKHNHSPGARKSYRARHKCDTKKHSKLSAAYWSCRTWESGRPKRTRK